MNEKTNEIRVQDDLYLHVNHEWLEKAVIPADKPCIGGFSTLALGVEELMINDFNEMINGNIEVTDNNVKKALELYKIALNVKKRNKDGIKPALKYLKKIDALTDIKKFNSKIVDLYLSGIALPFEIGVEADMKNSINNCLMMLGARTILPDTTYYKENMAPQKEAMLGFWKAMAKELLAYTPLDDDLQDKYLEDTFKFDSILSTLIKSMEEQSEYPKLYNPMKLNKVANLLKPIKFKKLLSGLTDFVPENIIVCEPLFVKGFKTLFNEENFEMYKHWAYVQTLVKCSSLLSEDLREKGTRYSRALTGVQEVPTIEKQAYGIASGKFSEPVGLYYGRKYFGEEAKKDVVEMVKEIIATYQKRIETNDVLSDETKKKAILKLNTMVVKMGYPDSSDPVYDKFEVNPKDNLLDAINSINRVNELYSFAKLSVPHDRTRWVMPGHIVNACYNPMTNDITFPAAILQPPFYSIKQSRSENLGGIGAVIGHEISHAFDNNGAKCDELGNLNDWWTKDDAKRFKAKTKSMIKQFEGLEISSGGKVNATLVVSENIADNGGMAVTLDIMKNMKDADYKAYFYNWAKVWCQKAKPEYEQLLLSIDVHAPHELRTNMPPRNFEEWYETFKVKKTDKMYIAPNKRLVIW